MSRIEDAFTWDPFDESYEITVTVRNGIVDLFGTVGTVFEKDQVEDIASRVNGVIAVNNYIVVAAVANPYRYPCDPFLDDLYYPGDGGPYYGSPMRRCQTDSEIVEMEKTSKQRLNIFKGGRTCYLSKR